ncbi:cytochrome P450 [Mycobacterium sp.]|uniref:cytochrome P450 n=1 Tax=Mycobacterium sp. TaxID=1785 RepID=UPI002D928D25|nr:cytochrome P450 [Mycobacterium sp.]
MWAGLDPDGFFRGRAGARKPFTVVFPGLGPVHFFATADAARDLFAVGSAMLEAPTPNPIEPMVGKGSVILVSGDEHRNKRRLLMPALHGQRMRSRAQVMARATRDETESWRPGERIALAAAARSIALRIIVLAMFGVEKAEQYQEFVDVTTALMHANTAPLMLLPWLRKDFAGMGPWARLTRLRERFDALLTEQVEGRCADTDHSVLGVLLAGMDATTTDPDDLHQQLRTLVVAGHDTTAGTLMWALYHIHRDPRIRERVNVEVAGMSAPEGLPELPYLSAVVSEALRMHPAVPIVMRRVLAPLTVGGIQWSPGDIVGIAVPAVHFDSSIWPDPYRFDPGRFLGKSPTPFEYLPFGGGFRRCPGASFAAYELAVSIGTLMNSVELQMPSRERRRQVPRSAPRGIAVVPRREVRLNVIRRR